MAAGQRLGGGGSSVKRAACVAAMLPALRGVRVRTENRVSRDGWKEGEHISARGTRQKTRTRCDCVPVLSNIQGVLELGQDRGDEPQELRSGGVRRAPTRGE